MIYPEYVQIYIIALFFKVPLISERAVEFDIIFKIPEKLYYLTFSRFIYKKTRIGMKFSPPICKILVKVTSKNSIKGYP